MKILNIIQCTNLGGMEQSTVTRCIELKKQGHDVSILSLQSLGPISIRLEKAGIPVRSIGYRGKTDILSILKVVRIIQSRSFDVICLTGHNFHAALAVCLTRTPEKIQFLHYHHFENGKPTAPWRPYYMLADRAFTKIVFCSNFIEAQALGIYPSMFMKTRVIHDPLHYKPSCSEADKNSYRQRLGIPTQNNIIGNAGWFIQRKRYDVFLQTAKKILAKTQCVSFVLAGNGPEKENLEAYAKSLGIEKHVFFIDWVEKMSDFYHCLDVLLFNSDYEAMGLTPLEAILHNVPTVMSVTHGDISRFFENIHPRLAYSNHDIVALSDVIIKILSDSVMRTRVLEEQKQAVLDSFSKEKHLEEFLKLVQTK